MRRRHVIGVILILSFIAFCGFTFSQSLTPYVGFKEARESGSVVQVKGELVDSAVSTIEGGVGITFNLRDSEGTTARVVYHGVKPENMEHSESVVAVGTFEGQDFVASQILVKCPSKYQTSDIQ